MRSNAWQDWNRNPFVLSDLNQMGRRELLRVMRTPFLLNARPAQRPPFGQDWRTWLFMGGRGAGKTRAGAEFLQFAMCHGGYRRAALVGPTLHDVREVMIEGPSGVVAIAADEDRAVYQASRRRLVWPNGGEAFVFSAEDPDSLRGPQFDIAWCDEIAAWAHGEATWDMLQMGLRLGDDPKAMATTTPRPVPLVKRLAADEATVVTTSKTTDNAANLAPGFLDAVERHYGGTQLGRQELDGELIEDPDGALWTRSALDAVRIVEVPGDLRRVVVAVDPPASEGPKADTCGIIGAGLSNDLSTGEKAYVIADASVQGLSPLNWAGRAVAVARDTGAEAIIAEANQGGEMVRHALNTAGCDVPVRLVHAKIGKRARAMPVAALYEAGRVAHVGVMRALEDEMCSFGVEGFRGSPDRVDALVWALWALLLDRKENPRVRRFES
ncbi:MAG: terminase family protein [Pseudomonadota bacterium]